ncbi:MAG: TrmB family transcriptional regulator [Halobacterium sp.]
MPDDAHLVARLQQFGFSEKEASVYLAAVEAGRGSASDIASDAGVSTSYVYDVCDHLEREGLVAVDDHETPTTIRANPPAEALDDRVREMTETMRALDRQYERPDDDFDTLEIIRSRQTLLRRIRSFVETAETDVFLTLPAAALDDLTDALRDAVERGCLVFVAVSGTEHADLRPQYGDVATVVKSWSKVETTYLCVDQHRGVIAPSTLLDWEHGDADGVAFQNYSTAVAVGSAFLGTVWAASEPVAVRRPDALPHDYGGNFRRALYDATLHRRAGRRVEATLSVRPTETDEPPHTITGTVTATKQGLVEPTDNDFGMENALHLDTGDRTVSVGAPGAFLEDFEATNVVLRDGEL